VYVQGATRGVVRICQGQRGKVLSDGLDGHRDVTQGEDTWGDIGAVCVPSIL